MTVYPTLTSTVDYPLHPDAVYEEVLWACKTPERPPDGLTAYDWRCPACVFAAQANIEIHGDHDMWWKQSGGSEPVLKTLSWMVARSLHWFREDAS